VQVIEGADVILYEFCDDGGLDGLAHICALLVAFCLDDFGEDQIPFDPLIHGNYY
jgi:hypothetical protein